MRRMYAIFRQSGEMSGVFEHESDAYKGLVYTTDSIRPVTVFTPAELSEHEKAIAREAWFNARIGWRMASVAGGAESETFEAYWQQRKKEGGA